MPTQKIRELLERESVPYDLLPHAEVYTAQATAQASHIPGSAFAKVTMLEADGRPVMAVLPAHLRVDLKRLQTLIGSDTIALAPERTIESLFSDCESGAEPPFGHLYGLDVYADESLLRAPSIAFNAGTHREAMRIPTEAFRRLAKPVIGSFAVSVQPREPLRDELGAWGG